MCDEAVSNNPAVFFLVPDHFKTQEMCNEALQVDPWSLYDIPDHFNTQKMCLKAVQDDPSSPQFVPDWLVAWGPVDDEYCPKNVWYDDEYWYHDGDMIEWNEGYQKREAQKVQIKEELLPIAWQHPDRVMGWCMPEDKKRWWK